MASYAAVAAQGKEGGNFSRQSYYRVSNDNRQSYSRPHSEQGYAPHSKQDIEPSSAEIKSLPLACAKLWEFDRNRLNPGQDFRVNVQGGKDIYSKEDIAENTLFSFVDHDIFNKPTISRFYALLDNYNSNEYVREQETQEDRQEEKAFIEEIYRTAPIKYLQSYLIRKGRISEDPESFKSLLHRIWFTLYNRGGGVNSSSAFEHVFVGEVKSRGGNKEVSGFHNWIHFYLEESKGQVDYLGLVLPRKRHLEEPDSHTQLLTVQFEWHGVLKKNSSIFIGTSPEFEIALYTLCFFEGEEDNYLTLGPYEVNVKVYHLGENALGSAFTIAEN